MLSLTVNGKAVETDADPTTPLLWFLRDNLGLTGTKYGCGIAMCGACTVHMDGMAIRSCSLSIADVAGSSITTIEGLGAAGDHPVQEAWIAEDVPQCGYCQPGMIMATAALLQEVPDPSDDDINQSITNICRCGTYPRIRKAIHRAADMMKSES